MKKSLFFYIFFLFVLLTAQENEKKYVWPLTIYNGLSSSFQEFRGNHFHAGIDLRTFQKTGYPVLAIADGVIEKVIMAKNNMGRVVFLKQDDGNLSIYGHLEKFRDDIETQVAREQQRRGEKYLGDYVLPRPLAVRQGAFIAFSGESGVGFAHLHLEIRDKLGAALNPLSLISNPPIDEHAPVLKGIILRSRGNFLLNNDLGEFYFKLHRKGSLYRLAETLNVGGPFDLELHAIDFSAGGHVIAPYSLEAYLDGQSYYQVAFDRLLRDDNNQLGMLYDMTYSSSSSFFYKLFFQSGFALEKKKSLFAEIFGLLLPGTHEIKIIVTDAQKNQSIAVIPLRKLSEADGIFTDKKYDLKTNANQVLLKAGFSTYINRDDVVIKIREFPRPAAWIKLRIVQGSQEQVVEAREYGDGVYFCFKPLNNDMHLQLRFILSDGRQPVEELQRNLKLLVLQSQSPRQFSYGDFIADFAAKTVLEPTVLLLEEEPMSAEYPMLAGPVRIGPDHFTFLDTVVFKFRIPPDQAFPQQLGIFKYQPLGKSWRYLKTHTPSEAGYVGCRVLNGGTFALLRDIYPPEIYFKKSYITHTQRLKQLKFRLRDRGKGIDERTLAIFLNGQRVDGEYDPDWAHVLVSDPVGLRQGKNELLVQVADFAGNRCEKLFNFHW